MLSGKQQICPSVFVKDASPSQVHVSRHDSSSDSSRGRGER